MSQISLGNRKTETYTLNDRLQMKWQELKQGSEVLQQYDYGYGYGQVDPAAGNLDTTKSNGQLSLIESWIGANKQATQKFRYDQIGRLKESAEYRGDNGALTYKQVFDFDRFGNLYRKAASNPTSGQQNPIAYTAIEDSDISKASNRFTSNTTYDDAGQVVSDNKFRSMNFAYDANGRQIKASRASVPDAWTVYDASGNRVATKINNIWRYMVYDAMGKLVAEYGEMSDGVGGVKYLQQDWQGSVRTVTNANGFVVSRTDHQAFGGEVGYGTGQRSIDQGYNRDAATRQGYGLTERDDATGLDHTWFRKNESAAGRWTSPDPYKGSMNLGDPQSFNRYSYVQNQPTNFVDPSGLFLAGPDTHYGPAIQGYGIFNGGLAGMMYLMEQLSDVAFTINNPVLGPNNTVAGLNMWVPAHSGATTIVFLPSTGGSTTGSGLSLNEVGSGGAGKPRIGGSLGDADRWLRELLRDLNECLSAAKAQYERRMDKAKEEYKGKDVSLHLEDAISTVGGLAVGLAVGTAGQAALGAVIGLGLTVGAKYFVREVPYFLSKNLDDKYAGATKRCWQSYRARGGPRLYKEDL